MFNVIPTKVTAKPYYGGKPARLEWSSNIILEKCSKTCAGSVFWYLPDDEP